MKRLEIVVEGQSEREFIQNILGPYLQARGVLESYNVAPIVVRTNTNSRGGMTKYRHLKRDIMNCLKSKNDELVVSMMVDYFRMPSNLRETLGIVSNDNHIKDAENIEQSISADISDSRFIPYIQLHEFEALLFAAKDGFSYCYGDDTRCAELFKIVDKYDNPEEINSSPDGAPSKRMLAIIPEYEKMIDGNTVIMQNGMECIMRKCPRFHNWIEKIVTKLHLSASGSLAENENTEQANG